MDSQTFSVPAHIQAAIANRLSNLEADMRQAEFKFEDIIDELGKFKEYTEAITWQRRDSSIQLRDELEAKIQELEAKICILEARQCTEEIVDIEKARDKAAAAYRLCAVVRGAVARQKVSYKAAVQKRRYKKRLAFYDKHLSESFLLEKARESGQTQDTRNLFQAFIDYECYCKTEAARKARQLKNSYLLYMGEPYSGGSNLASKKKLTEFLEWVQSFRKDVAYLDLEAEDLFPFWFPISYGRCKVRF